MSDSIQLIRRIMRPRTVLTSGSDRLRSGVALKDPSAGRQDRQLQSSRCLPALGGHDSWR